MPGPRTPFSRRRRAASIPLIAAAAFALPAAAQATAIGEQVDRGDGSSGASPWQWSLARYATVPDPRPLLISDDGRYAVLSYPSSATTTALYRRDVQANTLRLILDDVTATGAIADRTKLSVITKRALASADTNSTPDLYLVDPFTGAATLASVGPGGAAVGGVTKGAVTSDGKAVVYSTAAGTTRRDLATGAATTTAGVRLGYGFESANASDDQMTPDGRTFLASDGTVRTPSGTVSVAEASNQLSQGAVRIAAGGAVAVTSLLGSAWGSPDPDAGAVRVYSLTDGTRRTVRPQLPTGWSSAMVLAVAADGATATIGSLRVDGSTVTYALGRLDLATGAVTKTSDDMPAEYPTVLSRNGRYGLALDRHHLFAVPAVAGAQLPGGVDGASPLVYISYEEGCGHPQFYTTDGGRPHMALTRFNSQNRGWALPIGSVRVQTYVASTGTPMNSLFLIKGLETGVLNGYYGTVRVDASATFANGTTAFDRSTVAAYAPDDCYVLTL